MTNKLQTLSVHELKKKRDDESELCIIDVREQHEWQEVRIPGALLMPKDAISELINDHVSEKSKPLYLHCRSGMRSLHAAQTLLNLGYEEVYSVDGGIMEWEICGYPVERG